MRKTVVTDLPVDQGTGRLFRSAYSGRVRVQVSFDGAGRTKQSFKDECDVNRIMSRYLNSGILPEHLNRATAQFIDCSAVDFQEAQMIVAGARTLFAELPAAVRSRFRHDAAAFLEFVENPVNGPELARMGLATLRKDSVQGDSGGVPPVPPRAAPVAPGAGSSVPEAQRGTTKE